MNTVSWILAAVLAAAVGFAVSRIVKSKGSCPGCNGNCDCCKHKDNK